MDMSGRKVDKLGDTLRPEWRETHRMLRADPATRK